MREYLKLLEEIEQEANLINDKIITQQMEEEEEEQKVRNKILCDLVEDIKKEISYTC